MKVPKRVDNGTISLELELLHFLLFFNNLNPFFGVYVQQMCIFTRNC